MTDPDLSSELVFCLGDDFVVTAWRHNIKLNCLKADSLTSYGGGGVPLMALLMFSFSEERLECEAD